MIDHHGAGAGAGANAGAVDPSNVHPSRQQPQRKYPQNIIPSSVDSVSTSIGRPPHPSLPSKQQQQQMPPEIIPSASNHSLPATVRYASAPPQAAYKAINKGGGDNGDYLELQPSFPPAASVGMPQQGSLHHRHTDFRRTHHAPHHLQYYPQRQQLHYSPSRSDYYHQQPRWNNHPTQSTRQQHRQPDYPKLPYFAIAAFFGIYIWIVAHLMTRSSTPGVRKTSRTNRPQYSYNRYGIRTPNRNIKPKSLYGPLEKNRCLNFNCSWDVTRCDNFLETNYNGNETPCCVHILRDMSRQFDNIMVDLNVDYATFYGSLLGFVRSDRLIPWSADIDYIMTKGNASYLVSRWKNSSKSVGLALFHQGIHRVCATYDFMNGQLLKWKNSQNHSTLIHDNKYPYVDIYTGIIKTNDNDKYFGDDVDCCHNITAMWPFVRRKVYNGSFYQSFPYHSETTLVNLYGSNWRVPEPKRNKGTPNDAAYCPKIRCKNLLRPKSNRNNVDRGIFQREMLNLQGYVWKLLQNQKAQKKILIVKKKENTTTQRNLSHHANISRVEKSSANETIGDTTQNFTKPTYILETDKLSEIKTIGNRQFDEDMDKIRDHIWRMVEKQAKEKNLIIPHDDDF